MFEPNLRQNLTPKCLRWLNLVKISLRNSQKQTKSEKSYKQTTNEKKIFTFYYFDYLQLI